MSHARHKCRNAQRLSFNFALFLDKFKHFDKFQLNSLVWNVMKISSAILHLLHISWTKLTRAFLWCFIETVPGTPDWNHKFKIIDVGLLRKSLLRNLQPAACSMGEFLAMYFMLEKYRVFMLSCHWERQLSWGLYCIGNLHLWGSEFNFPLQLNLPDFIEDSRSAVDF
jgi:hypothetical protein